MQKHKPIRKVLNPTNKAVFLLLRTWVTAFQTSESWETGSVAVVFGSREGILHTMQAAHYYSVNAGLQWLFVLLDMPREFSSLGMCTLSSLPIEQRCQTCGSQSFIMWPTHVLTCKIFHCNYKQFFPILNVKKSH